jgi:hypothetical protein
MRTSNKLAVTLLAVVGTILILSHANTAIHPTLPTDMPRGADFVPVGYDLSHLEAKGDWIACSTDTAQNADFCRITDARGEVVYQGDFMPLGGVEPVPANQLQVARINAEHLWVKGPAEGGPVPVIPLLNGEVLVPADDSEALADRWVNNPLELRQIQGAEL